MKSLEVSAIAAEVYIEYGSGRQTGRPSEIFICVMSMTSEDSESKIDFEELSCSANEAKSA